MVNTQEEESPKSKPFLKPVRITIQTVLFGRVRLWKMTNANDIAAILTCRVPNFCFAKGQSS